jgi:hypothetical protein
MQQFYSNCTPNSSTSSAVSFNEHLQLVWPTVNSVRESLGGFVGGAAVKWRPHDTDNKVNSFTKALAILAASVGSDAWHCCLVNNAFIL